MITYDTLKIGNSPLQLLSDDTGNSLISYRGKQYKNLSSLFKDIPELLKSHQNTAAQIINFMLQQQLFDVVTNVDAFQARYDKQLVKEEKIHDIQTFRTSSYGIYDVKNMHIPKWNEGKLVFFAVNNALGIPYKVTYKPPKDDIKGECSYELLPRKM